MRVVSFKIEEELLEKIDLLAKINNLSRSELIRRAVKALVDGDEGSFTLLYPREWLEDEITV